VWDVRGVSEGGLGRGELKVEAIALLRRVELQSCTTSLKSPANLGQFAIHRQNTYATSGTTLLESRFRYAATTVEYRRIRLGQQSESVE